MMRAKRTGGKSRNLVEMPLGHLRRDTVYNRTVRGIPYVQVDCVVVVHGQHGDDKKKFERE